MDIQDYETVLAVYQYKSWTEAAYQTYQVSSTVSKRVSKVEKALGVRLFERGSKQQSLRLTEAGELVLPYLTQVVNLHSRILSYASAMQNAGGAELTVGYPPLIGTTGEAEILARFRANHPDVKINHVLRHKTELVRLVCEGKLDCAFVFTIGDMEANRELREKLMSIDIGMITILRWHKRHIGMSCRHPLAGQKTVSMAQLQNEQFVFNTVPEHEDYENGYIRYILPYDNKVRIKRMDFINKSMVVDYIADGYGVLPTACIPPDDIPDIRFLETEDSMPASCVFIYSKGAPCLAVRELVKYVRDYAAERGLDE